MLLLFDISKWNVFADYKLLAQRSIGGFIKASEGVWPDRLFKTHWTETKKVGLLRGAYHFWRPDRTPKEQAERLFATVNETGSSVSSSLWLEDNASSDSFSDSSAAHAPASVTLVVEDQSATTAIA